MAIQERTVITKTGPKIIREWVLGPKVHTKPKYTKKEQKAKRVERDRAATLLADEVKKAAAARKAEREAAAKIAAAEAEAKAAAAAQEKAEAKDIAS